MAIDPGISLGLILLGLILAFKGWAVHEEFVKLFGFLIGFLIGAGGAVLTVAGSGGTGTSIEAALLIILLAGVGIGAVSSYVAIAYERLFVSVTGLLVAMGVPLLYGGLGAFGVPGGGSAIFTFLSLPLGLVGAYVAWKSYKGMVILMTAVLGGGLATAGASFITGGLGIASFVIVTPVGALYQLSGVSIDGGDS